MIPEDQGIFSLGIGGLHAAYPTTAQELVESESLTLTPSRIYILLMLDLKELRKDPVQAEQKLKNKLPEASLPPILALDEKLRAQKTEVDELKAKRNLTSKLIGQLKQKGQDPSSVMQEMGDIGDRIVLLDQEIVALEKKLSDLLATLPNLPMDDVPVSPNAADNVCIKEWGKKPLFSFPLKHHVELNERLHLFDFQRAAKLSGAGWPLYVGLGARLEWALLNYMLHTHRKKGFTQVIPPLLVKPEVMYGSSVSSTKLQTRIMTSISFQPRKCRSMECISMKF